MSKRLRPLLPLLATMLWACGDTIGPGEPITELPRELSVAEGKLIDADNRFAFRLFREVVAQDTTEGNIFISPLSVAMALGMTYNGAAGETREAMARTLELQGLDIQEVNEAYRSLIDLLRGLDPRVEWILANSIWYRETLVPLPQFLDVNRQYFDAEVAGLDFNDPAVAARINGWVDDATRGRITEIVPDPMPMNIVMYLINAVYFKGAWTDPFDPDRTRSRPFTLASGSEVMVAMMAREQARTLPLARLDEGLIFELPYSRGAHVMTVVLPAEGMDLGTISDGLDADRWNTWMASLDSTSVFIELPKLEFAYELTLNDVLSALGMGIALTPAADFSNMYQGGGPWIDEVKHKTFVKVDEEGTEAAAATSVSMVESLPPTITVDRPFFFAIRERFSGTVLFMGRVMDPNT